MKAEYKPIKAVDVARSIVNESKKIVSGNKIYHYSEMKNSNWCRIYAGDLDDVE